MALLSFQNFWQQSSQFQLGHLTTESSHPLTQNLSYLAKNDPKKALNLFKEIDAQIWPILRDNQSLIDGLTQALQEVKEAGGKVYFCGCGATGRLSLLLESCYRMKESDDFVMSFIAGGDFALIKSIESFEDNSQYAIGQMDELGFGKNDLLIAITEGGETSFVLAAAQYAQKVSSHSPWFLYCNPDKELAQIKRSQEVLQNKSIHKVNLTTGAMALSGSTRLQASSIQLAFCLLALFPDESLKDWEEAHRQLSYDFLLPLLEKELTFLNQEIPITYQSEDTFGVTVLSDTTERSPTFSIPSFEKNSEGKCAPFYYSVKGEQDSMKAWYRILGRRPRCLSWKDLSVKIDLDELIEFDISQKAIVRRKGKVIAFKCIDDKLLITIDEKLDLETSLGSASFLWQQLALKFLLNADSTVLMGQYGRFENNIMTWVKASNYKLIDRASRYLQLLADQEGIELNYQKAVELIFENRENEPVVLSALNKLRQTN